MSAIGFDGYARSQIPLIGAAASAVAIIADGDSKSAESIKALNFVKARNPIDFIYWGDIGVGGSDTSASASTNLTHATRLASAAATVAAALAAGFAKVDIHLTIGTNDIGLSGTPTSETIIANIRKYHNAMRAAGIRYLWLWSIDPRASMTATQSRRLMATNRAYQDYAELNPDVIFVDTHPYLVNTATTNVLVDPIGLAAGAAFAVTYDGLHAAGYGFYRKSYAVEPLALKMYRPLIETMLTPGDAYSATDAIRGNILNIAYATGNSGTTVGTGRTQVIGGTTTPTLSGTGTVTGTPPLGWTCSPTLTGDMSIVWTQEDATALNTRYNTSGLKCVRATFTGTPSADITLTMTRAVGFTQSLSPMIVDGLAYLNALVGCHGIYVNTQNVTSSFSSGIANTTGTIVASDQMPSMTGLCFMRATQAALASPSANANCGVNFNVKFKAGVAISGSIDFIGASIRLMQALPASA